MTPIRTTLAAIVAAFACSAPVLAETFPVPTPDPHASSWGQRGSFTLYYYGQLNDGTACPPSPNALQYAITGGGKGLLYLHRYSIDTSVDPALQAPFEKGTFCSLAFDGEARFLLHHGQSAHLRPTAVSPVEPMPGEGDPTAEPHGKYGVYTISYAAIVCHVAPCPPGSYSIVYGDNAIAQVKTLIVEAPPEAPAHFAGQYLPFEEIEGYLDLDGSTATIRIGE